jgi:hypothetical protein
MAMGIATMATTMADKHGLQQWATTAFGCTNASKHLRQNDRWCSDCNKYYYYITL